MANTHDNFLALITGGETSFAVGRALGEQRNPKIFISTGGGTSTDFLGSNGKLIGLQYLKFSGVVEEPLPLTLAIPEKFRDQYYSSKLDAEIMAGKKYRRMSIASGKTRQEILLDESLSPSASTLLQGSLQEFAKIVPKSLRGDWEGIGKPVRIVVADRSPLMMQAAGSGTIVVNRFYFDFLEWLSADTRAPFGELSLSENGKTTKGITGNEVEKSNARTIFDALTLPLLYHFVFQKLSSSDYYGLVDKWVFHARGWTNRSVPGQGNTMLRDLWEVCGSFLSDPCDVERLYMPNAAMIAGTFPHMLEGRSDDFRRGFKNALKEALTGYASVGEITKRIEIERQHGHQLLSEHPEFATAYVGRGSDSFSSRAKPTIPDRVDGAVTWLYLYKESEYRLGNILAMVEILIHQNRLGDEKYSQKDQFKFWKPLEQLVFRPHHSSATRRLVDLIHLLNVTRWGEDDRIPLEESLFNNVDRHPYHKAMQAELQKLDFDEAMNLLIQKFGHELAFGTWQAVMREIRGQDEKIAVLETFRRLTEVRKPVREDLEKFIDYLYRTYPKETIHDAALQSITAQEADSGHVLTEFSGDAATWRGDTRYRPYHDIYAGDSHVLFAQWLGDIGLRREIKAAGYPLPSLNPILGTDGPIDPNSYDGMLSINIKPIYFDEEFMEIISQRDPELLDKLIAFLEEKSVAEEGSHYEPRQENVPGKQWGRVYRERLNYLFLIKKHYPRIFAVLTHRKPALAGSIIDLNQARTPAIALQKDFAFSEFSWDKPHFYMQALNVFKFLTINGQDQIVVTQPHLANWRKPEEEIPVMRAIGATDAAAGELGEIDAAA